MFYTSPEGLNVFCEPPSPRGGLDLVTYSTEPPGPDWRLGSE